MSNLSMESLDKTIYFSPQESPSKVNSQAGFETPGNSGLYFTPGSIASDHLGIHLPKRTSAMSHWSPSDFSLLRSPNVNFSAGKNKWSSPSSAFLKRREFKSADKKHCPVYMHKSRKTLDDSSIDLDETLNVKMVLKDLKLAHLNEAFEKQEIDLDALFSMSDETLLFIGVIDGKERKKILEFTNDFRTPTKPKKIPCKNFLVRPHVY